MVRVKRVKRLEDAPNLLEMHPVKNPKVRELVSGNRTVLEIEREDGIYKLTKLLRGKPKTFVIELDEIGSTVWRLIDGKRSVADIAMELEKRFGDRVKPTEVRLALFLKMLERAKLITYAELVKG